jgi:DEAD/DEAH box helicase domain-containing protein
MTDARMRVTIALKVYRNMNYHSLLDWRLGVAMMRVMSDSTFVCGTDGNFNQFIELRDWLAFATELRNSFALRVLASLI